MQALAVPIFCVVTLYAHLADGAQRTLALRLSVFAYAVPALSRSPLDSKQESIRIPGHIFSGPLGAVEIASVSRYSAGCFVLTIAIWRLGALSGWAGVLIAGHALLVSGPFSVVGSVAGTSPAISSEVRTLRAQGSLPLGSNSWPMSLYRPCTNIEGSKELGHKGE